MNLELYIVVTKGLLAMSRLMLIGHWKNYYTKMPKKNPADAKRRAADLGVSLQPSPH